MYGTGPEKPMSLRSSTCHIVRPEPTHGLCGIPIGRVIGEYNAPPLGWTLCEQCYLEAGRQAIPSSSDVLGDVERLLEQDLPRARKLWYNADAGEDDRQPA